MKVLVTGGAGFIGSHLIRTIDKKGDVPIVVDNLSAGLVQNVPKGIKLYDADILGKETENIFREEKFDTVVHLAAQTLVTKSLVDPVYDMYQNIAGTVRILELSKRYGIKRVVFSSSAATYGDVPTEKLPIQESSPLHPLSFYGLSKQTAERYISMYHRLFGLDYVVLRFSNVYGERQGDGGEGGVISIFAQKIAHNDAITIYGDGYQTRDFIYAGDVAEGICAALHTPYGNTVYNLSTQTETTVNEITELLAQVKNQALNIKYAPAREGDIRRSVLSNEKAKENLKWNPKMTFSEGLARTYRYFINDSAQ